VGLGSYDLNAPSLQVSLAQAWWTNAGFDLASGRDDVALIRLDRAAAGPGIRLERSSESQLSAPGTLGRIAGWGTPPAARRPR